VAAAAVAVKIVIEAREVAATTEAGAQGMAIAGRETAIALVRPIEGWSVI